MSPPSDPRRHFTRAENEIEDIWLSIASDDPSVAIRITRDLGQRIDSLADYPRLGPRRRDIAPAMRVLVEGAYLMVYEHQPNTDGGPVDVVDIIGVLDGRRDLTELF
jgi:toxin ParE1/3/4